MLREKIKKALDDAIENVDIERIIKDQLSFIDIGTIVESALDDFLTVIDFEGAIFEKIEEIVNKELEELDIENMIKDAINEV